MISALIIILFNLQNLADNQGIRQTVEQIETHVKQNTPAGDVRDRHYFLVRFNTNDSTLSEQFEPFLKQEISLAEIETEFLQRIKQDQIKGRWFSEIQIRDISVDIRSDSIFLNLFIFYKESEQINLDTISFEGIKQTDPAALMRETRLKIGQKIAPEDLQIANNFIKQSLFVQDVYSYELRRYSKLKTGFHFRVKELSTFFLNVIIGYVPGKQNEDPFFTGDIQIAYDNMGGSGRAIDLLWQKLNRQSERIEISYTEPWILDQPVNGRFDVKRHLIDSVFTKTAFTLALDFAVNHQFTASVFGRLSSTNPTDSLRALTHIVPFSEETETGISVQFLNTDRKYNPRTGFRAKLQFSHINSDVLRPDWLIEQFNLKTNYQKDRLEFDIDYFINHYDNHVILLRNISRYIESDQLFANDRYYFGGSKTIRGFRENQYNSNWYSQFGLEYRLLTSAETRLFFFADAAYFENENKQKSQIGSFGFGARLKTSIGILGVDYALESGSAFRDGKIHIGIFGKIQ